MIEHGIAFQRIANGDGVFSVNVMVDGQRIHRVVGRESDGTTRTHADEFIQKIRRDAREDRLSLPKRRKTVLGFTEAANQYLQRLGETDGKDLKAKRSRLRLHLRRLFGDLPISKLTAFDVDRYKQQRSREGAKFATINRELAVLSHVMNKALEWEWLHNAPPRIGRLQEDRARITYLTVEQCKRLLHAARHDQSAHIYPFIVIALATSMRRMEILSIRLEHIDLQRSAIWIPKAKAGAREQPITSELSTFFRGYLKALPTGTSWLFSSSAASGHAEGIRKPFRRVVQRAGLDPDVITPHTLRHTVITHLVQAGVDLPTVKRISGHKTLSMVERYAHANAEHIRAAMDKLEKRYNTPPSV